MTATDMPSPGTLVLTDSGLETDLIFNRGWDLPAFASFPLLLTENGRSTLEDYYREHVDVAVAHGIGFVFETPTWRASSDWGDLLGYAPGQIDEINSHAVRLVTEIRDSTPALTRGIVNGALGPRGDGYAPSAIMTTDEARTYHSRQVQVFADAGCDAISVLTLSYAAEGLGIALAARDAGLPVVVSFTVETDGTLPDGSHLGEVVESIDAATDGYVSYFGINCAHPEHMAPALSGGDQWVSRIGLVRANASRLSHAELDESDTLHDGDPVELAADYVALQSALRGLRVVGGCCGTDVRHVQAIANALAPV
jgi:homocysteine S-methyltransferase